MTIFGSALQIREAILKSEGVLGVFFRNLKTLKEIFQDLKLRQGRRVFALVCEDIQRMIWKF